MAFEASLFLSLCESECQLTFVSLLDRLILSGWTLRLRTCWLYVVTLINSEKMTVKKAKRDCDVPF